MDFSTVLQGLVGLLWIVVVGLIVIAVLRASRNQKNQTLFTAIIGTAALAVVVTTLSAGLVFIQPDQRGVVISALAPKGYREQALQPGLRWIIPYFENVVIYPISRQTYTMSVAVNEGQIQGDDSISARTADGQEVFIDSSVIYAIDPEKVINVHIQWQNRYQNDLVRAQARGVIRDAVSQFRVDELISSKRTELVNQMQQSLGGKMSDNGLILVDFVLRNITFSPEYAASVEQKQIAEQQAQQAKFVVEQRKQEAEQARQIAQGQADAAVINAKGQASAILINAEAEAKRNALIAQSLKDSPDLLQYNYINKIAPGIQVMLVPNNAPYLLPLPTMSPSTGETGNASPTPLPIPTPLPTPTATP